MFPKDVDPDDVDTSGWFVPCYPRQFQNGTCKCLSAGSTVRTRRKLAHLLANPSDSRIMHRIPRHHVDYPIILVRTRFKAFPSQWDVVEQVFGLQVPGF